MCDLNAFISDELNSGRPVAIFRGFRELGSGRKDVGRRVKRAHGQLLSLAGIWWPSIPSLSIYSPARPEEMEGRVI